MTITTISGTNTSYSNNTFINNIPVTFIDDNFNQNENNRPRTQTVSEPVNTPDLYDYYSNNTIHTGSYSDSGVNVNTNPAIPTIPCDYQANIERIQSILFENSDSIPDGLYLQLMNATIGR